MPPYVSRALRKAVRTTAGLTIGGLTAFAELAFVLVTGPVLAVPPARRAIFAKARLIAEFERRRLAKYLDVETPDDYPGRRAWQYLAVRWLIGWLGIGVLVLIAAGAVTGLIMGWQVINGRHMGGGQGEASWYDPITLALFGGLLIFVTLQGFIGVVGLDRKLAVRLLNPGGQELLRRRVTELATSRAEVVEVVNEERRRIERDLHDGVQQRLVALGMLLGRARRAKEQEHADELLRQAHLESQLALNDLREVTWRVYPIALHEAGLHTALEALAERSSLPVRFRYELARRADIAVETVAYFVVSEAVTNAIKHAGATLVEIEVRQSGTIITVRIIDDGAGGADASGSGLSGLARRVAAADGRFTVDSPAGGPTTITAELPCG
ncbi:sensor histidine kinase [Amycolatopsis nigrescens]|uniref:sensor histidine kinase n=1 Tax=Amycolatopsis nigrescens TaxID=381445 RepID=UPI000362E181|nr:histidine kinase [Amycolatopsis nigrescens]